MIRNKQRKAWVIGTFILASVLTTPQLIAATVPWREASVAYTAKGKPLAQVLKDILATQPFPVVIKSDIRGEVRGDFNKSARAIFSELEAAYGFIWYFDGSSMYITSSADSRSEVVAIAPLSGTQAMQALGQLGLIEARFPVKVSGGSVLVSGPSRYVELVVKALESERERAAQWLSQRNMSLVSTLARPASSGTGGGAGIQIRTFPLRYAQAQDSSRSVRGDYAPGDYVVPGVATLLRNLLQGVYATPKQDKSSLLQGLAAGHALSGLAPSSVEEDGDDLRVQALLAFMARQQQGNPSEGEIDRNVRIQADVRTNSVVIADTPAMMPIYEQLIAQLDRPQRLVQMDVAIIDINSSDARDLGVDLSLRGDRGDLHAGGAGLTFDAVIGSSMPQLKARLALLETQGRARVLSRPKIMTLDNTEAFMGNEQTFYLKSAGDNYANVVPISAGLSFRATPLIIPMENTPPRVKLSLEIVDGNFSSSSVDNVPGSNRKYLATQALIGDGQSLLVGGFQYENRGHDISGVPGLSRIPGIGSLFRRKRKSNQQVERLFLITPRVVDGRLDDTPLLESLLPKSAESMDRDGSGLRVQGASMRTPSLTLEPVPFRNEWEAPPRAIDLASPVALPIEKLPPVPHRNKAQRKSKSRAAVPSSRDQKKGTDQSESEGARPTRIDSPLPSSKESPALRGTSMPAPGSD